MLLSALSNLVGTHLIMLMGNFPEPVPLALSEALRRVEVTQSDDFRSGFQLTFAVGRGLGDVTDYALLTSDKLRPFTRVLLIVSVNAKPEALLDGVITHWQLTPSEEPGNSNLVVTGKDLTQMMDLEEKQQPHPNGDSLTIINRILEPYTGQYALSSDIQNPTPRNPDNNLRNPEGNPNNQTSTDLDYIRFLAEEVGYVFYIKPGLYPTSRSVVYWGDPVQLSNLLTERQSALSVNMGPFSNVESINFQYDALKPEYIQVNERTTEAGQSSNSAPPIEPDREPPLVKQPALIRKTVIYNLAADPEGRNPSTERSNPQAQQEAERARAKAQARCNRSFREAVTARGELDTAQYGGLLTAGKLVDLRGVGFAFDGTYYVKEVTHRINLQTGEFKQSFTLNREGFGAKYPTVSL